MSADVGLLCYTFNLLLFDLGCIDLLFVLKLNIYIVCYFKLVESKSERALLPSRFLNVRGICFGEKVLHVVDKRTDDINKC